MTLAAPTRDKTYDDYLAVPEGTRAELIDGVLYMSPQPKGRHVGFASRLGAQIGHAFGLTPGPTSRGPGGWWILDEPECHLVALRRVVIPDIAGWQREKMPTVPRDDHKFLIVPDWVCEVLSPGTRGRDYIVKMPAYLEAGVKWLWMVEPVDRRIDVYRAHEGAWVEAGGFEGDVVVRLPPFEEVTVDLSLAWTDA